jgi:hypothetical protein
MNMMLTEVESKQLAEAIHTMRPEWGVAGIHKALGYARHKANKWDVALAAFACAANPDNRTPAVIPMDGRHWPVVNAPESPKKHQPRPITEDERDAAHRQYLAAVAILNAKRAEKHTEEEESDADAV